MDPLTMLLVGGGLMGGLAYGGYAAQKSLNKQQMKFNAEQAALQRSWMERMSNTAHQRQVKDLRAAGLNPILSAGGSGAQVGTPSAASISGLKSPFAAGMDAVTSAASAAGSVASIGTDLKRLGLEQEMNPAKLATEASKQRLNLAQAAEATDRIKDGGVRRELMREDAKLRREQQYLTEQQGLDAAMSSNIKDMQYNELYYSWQHRVDEAEERVNKLRTETGRIKTEKEREELGYWLDIVDRGVNVLDVVRRLQNLKKGKIRR